MLFNEPKLLKLNPAARLIVAGMSFSALQRAEIAEIFWKSTASGCVALVSVLFNEPKLLKFWAICLFLTPDGVSVLFNEPKLLKSDVVYQRTVPEDVSVLFNEPKLLKWC